MESMMPFTSEQRSRFIWISIRICCSVWSWLPMSLFRLERLLLRQILNTGWSIRADLQSVFSEIPLQLNSVTALCASDKVPSATAGIRKGKKDVQRDVRPLLELRRDCICGENTHTQKRTIWIKKKKSPFSLVSKRCNNAENTIIVLIQ